MATNGILFGLLTANVFHFGRSVEQDGRADVSKYFHGSMTSWGLSAAYCINIQCQRLLCILLIADMLHHLGQSNSKLLKPCKSWDKLPNPTLLSEI